MPTYEYACAKCGHEMEAFQSMKDDPLKKCPACGRLSLRRKVGRGAGLIFKGTGFYITDYKKSSHGAKDSDGAKESSRGKDSGGEKPAAKPTETKPAAKAAAK